MYDSICQTTVALLSMTVYSSSPREIVSWSRHRHLQSVHSDTLNFVCGMLQNHFNLDSICTSILKLFNFPWYRKFDYSQE